MDTMMVMFSELRAREIRAGAEGYGGEFKELSGGKCPIREVQDMLDKRAAATDGDSEQTGNGQAKGAAL